MKIYLLQEWEDYFGYHIVDETLYSSFEEAKNHEVKYGKWFEICEIDTDTLSIKTVFSDDDYWKMQDEKETALMISFAETLVERPIQDILGYCYNQWYYDFTDDSNYLYLDIYNKYNDKCISLCIGGYDITQGFDEEKDMDKVKSLKPFRYLIYDT